MKSTTNGAAGAARIWFVTIEHVSIKRMEHVGIVVDDLAAATEFFIDLGLVLQGARNVATVRLDNQRI